MQNSINVEIKKQIESNEHKRYVLSIVSWQEEVVVENLKERVKKQGLEKDVVDYLIPTINEWTMRKWEKIIKVKKLYPWYVFVKSKMNDKIRYVVRNTPWVRLIVWAETHPVPLSDDEYNKIIIQMQESKQRAELRIPFKQWDLVVLKSWDFKWMQWLVIDIDTEKELITVNIEMLWRQTPVTVWIDKLDIVS